MKFKVNNFFGRLFGASSKEVGGVLVLVAFIFMGIVFVKLIDRYTTTGYQQYMADSLMLDSLLATMEADAGIGQPSQAAVVYFTFNPNLATLDELISLGLDSAIARRIIKYRDKGGVYRKKSDLRKIYGLSETKFNELYDYINIPVKVASAEQPVPQEFAKPTNKAKPKVEFAILPKFDLNLADTSVLQTVIGIGSVLSGRIISFRDKLGGFVEVDQLYQVYNLDSVVVSRLITIGFIAPGFEPELIDINSVGVDEIAAHPYINWNQARLLVAYRNQHGRFKEAKDLAEVYSFDQEFVEKIKPYMSFDG